jgi:chorismate lyase/3-hydroxybenzoate synthase
LHTIDGHERVESWSGTAATANESIDGICAVTSNDHVVLHARIPACAADGITAATAALYGNLIGRARSLGYPQLLRTWNFVPDINRGDGDCETYVRFSRGRAVALDRLGVAPTCYPAATAVGALPGSPLLVIVLASRSEPLTIENPRQMSAYLYPRKYGPRSPAFARATLLRHSDGGTLFISGTASIVGHESRHDEFGAQLAETVTNLEQLLAVAEQRAPDLAVTTQRSWRVYLRHAGDAALAESAITDRLGSRQQLLLLQADICRRELLVEIEGVCTLAARAPEGA